MPLTYKKYLKLDSVLSAQDPQSGDHNEMLFIINHQIYELWFKQLIHELYSVVKLLKKKNMDKTHHRMRRILKIIKLMVQQVDVLETLTPLEFLTFREKLQTASAMHSVQYWELMFLFGKKSPQVINRFPEGPEKKQLAKAMNKPSLWLTFLNFLHESGYKLPEEIINRDVSVKDEEFAEVREVLMEVYCEEKNIAAFCEMLIDLDEGFQEWRYRHLKLVERTIGTKPGTGGSAGVEYLKASVFDRFFPDLWKIRADFTRYDEV